MNSNRNDLSSIEISKHLPGKLNSLPVFVYQEIDSTNNEAKRRALEGSLEKGLIVADSQTMGRGRIGRTFFSPSQGIYMSYVFTPENLENASHATTKAGYAVWKSIKELYGINPQIKWVNDIYFEGRKICGILSEAVVKEINKGTVVVGIGINFSSTKVPDEISSKAGFLPDRCEITRNMLIGKIIGILEDECNRLDDVSYLKEYRSASMLTGKDISYYENDILKTAFVIDIDDDAGLVVKLPDNSTTTLRNGEVFSLKEL